MAYKHGEQRHIRLAHFLINGCTTLARALVGKDVKVSKPREHEPVDKPWSLDSFLHKNMKILCKKCNPIQQDILFPGHQDKSDIEQWDISLLCLVITNCTNNETVRGDIKQLKNTRNIIFHAGNTDISQEVYDRNVEILDCIVERCCKFIDEPNFSLTMKELQENFKRGNVIVTDKDFEAICQWYESDPLVILNSKVDKLSDDQQLMMTKTDEILALMKQSGLRGIVLPDTNVELIVKNCDSAKEKVISEYLVKLLKCRMADDIPNVPEADKQKVFDLVKEAMAELLTGGRELVDIYQACVNFTIRCATFASLRDLWIDCMTGKLTRAFKPLEIFVRQLTGCPDITIEVEITQFEFYRCFEATVMQIPKAVQAGNDDVFGEQADLYTEIASACIDDIDTDSSRHSPDKGAVTRTEGDGTRVIIRMQPTSFNQAEHLWRACQSDRFNDKLERLSQAIQEAYGFSDLSITAKAESTSPYEENLSSNLSKSIDIRTEEERTKEEKQIKDNEPIPGSDNELIPGSDNGPIPGSDNESIPGSDNEPIPGLDNQPIPGSDNEPIPGSDNEPIPGSDNQSIPGSDNQPIPGSDNESIHGSNDESSADDEGSDILSNFSEKTQLKEIDFRAEGKRIMERKQIKAMASRDKYLKDPEYANWVKSGLALNITNEVLRPFVVKEITKLHHSIVKTLPPGVSCTGCNVNTRCPNSICDKIQREIENRDWYLNPSFTNTCTRRWSTEPWEIAKCFMPSSKGCRDISIGDADFSACISVIINCKHFQAFGTSDPNITETDCSKSKEFWNLVMHSSSQNVSEEYMRGNLDILINILNMIKTPETEDDTKEAIEMIEKTKQLKIRFEDAIEVTKNAIEANADNLDKDEDQVQRKRLLVNFEAGCRKALCRLTEDHINKNEENDETMSVVAFLSKLRTFPEIRNLCSMHQEMLFPKSGTPKDIGQWDMFVYCFILEDIDLYESPGNAVSNFVKEVKVIRDKLLLYATGVTQNELSELCDYLIDTDLKTEIAEIFKKDASRSTDVDVIRSYNTLKSWWRDEEEYGKKPASRKQLNINRQLIQKVKSTYETVDNTFEVLLETLGYRGRPLYGDCVARIECNVEPRGCDTKTEKAIEKNITYSNNEDLLTCIDDFRRQRYLLEVNPEEGCIILNVKCSSITNVLDFWDSCIDGRAVEALTKVRDYYRRYFKCDTLEFDVILTKKGVSSCVNEIVEGLQPLVQEMIDKVTDKVHEILKAKETPSLTQLKEIGFRAGGERTMEGIQIKDTQPPTCSEKDSMVVDEELEILVKSDNPASNLPKSIDIRTEEERTKKEKPIKETPSLSLLKEIDIRAEEERITEGKQIKGDSVRDINKLTMEEVDRLVKDLRQIFEDLKGNRQTHL